VHRVRPTDWEIDLLSIEWTPTAEGEIVTQANNAVGATAELVLARPPRVPLADGANPIVVTLCLSAKDAGDFERHLRDVIPVTRIASRCRYSHT
jgi:hypothetical protein